MAKLLHTTPAAAELIRTVPVVCVVNKLTEAVVGPVMVCVKIPPDAVISPVAVSVVSVEMAPVEYNLVVVIPFA